jgi:hypothetical protein
VFHYVCSPPYIFTIILDFAMRTGTVLLIFAAIAYADEDCGFFPVAIPVENVQLSNGASLRGYPIAVGDPPQLLSFMLDMYV